MVAVAGKGVGGPRTSGERGPEKAPSGFGGRLLRAIRKFLKRERYEPARHYMRGPGPASSQRANKTPRDDK
jgi:hypothetical protein